MNIQSSLMKWTAFIGVASGCHAVPETSREWRDAERALEHVVWAQRAQRKRRAARAGRSATA